MVSPESFMDLETESRGWSRGFSIGVGMIMIVTGIPGRRVGIRL